MLVLLAAGIVIVALMFSGCSSPPISTKLVVQSIPAPKTVGSLWQEENGRAYLYEDMRAMRVGDIITIKIQEQQAGSKSADTSAQRESTLTNSINGGATGTIGIPGVRLGAGLQRSLGVDASAQNKFTGKGATNRADTLTGTLSAMVTEV